MKREPEIVVISDVHLGTYGCHAAELLQYLKHVKPRILILNGDFIDMWQFRKRYFPRDHMRVIQRILRMAAKGTKVYYITGNHDDLLRRYTDFSTGNIHLRDKLVLQLKNKKVWFFHGDVFDLSVRYSPFIAKMGGKSYDYLIVLNRWVNRVRSFWGWQPMSLAKAVKQRVKHAVKFISDFEETAIQQAANQEYDYVVCGHIHLPQIRTARVGDRLVNYLNSGDWVENLTALEYQWGQWSLYTFDETDYQSPNEPARNLDHEDDDEAEELSSFDKNTNQEILIQHILGK
ncbi:MAG: UDP-2,3-diacylglucosamine diphosphatase [Saprospiraceae bacterium]